MKQLVFAGLVAGAAAGIFQDPDAGTFATGSTSHRVAPAQREAQTFPLSGRWRFADAGSLLPKNAGCGPSEASLSLSPRTISVSRGDWHQTLYSLADWRLEGASDLVLTLSGGGSPILERARLTLDLSSAGFVRFKSATDEDGHSLQSRIARLPADRQDIARTELANLSGALTLLRCADSPSDAVALMRGSLPPSNGTWVLR